jgi:hypothetical protein
MSKRTLIGLMFCTLFLSAPVFAQESTAQPVIQTAQAAQNDVTIPTGATQEFDAAKGEIKFDGVLTNKGTIIIRSSNPAQTEAILSAEKFVNEGRIVSEVPSLTINASILGGTGDYNAPEAINVRGTDRLEIRGGRFYSEWFRPKTKGWLIINANRIDGKVELEAEHLSMGVREGNLNVIKQKLDGDPLIYNTGGDITTPIAPSGGHDLLIIASGDVIVSGGIDATGSATQDEGNIAILTGAHFARPHDGEVILPCGISNGQGNDCNNLADSMSLPGMPLEPALGDFPMSGKIVISGEVRAHVIIMTSREIEINGNLHAVEDGMLDGAAISLFATKSITVTGTIKADANTVEPSFSAVSLIAPTVNVSNKITSDAVTIEAFENSEASTGSVTTAAIEARRYLDINGGHIQFSEAGGALTGSTVLPLSQPHDSGEFTIKTGKLTAHQFINLAATGNIDAGNIELLTNELEVPLYTHDVRIHANVGKEDAPPLKIGGGTNGAASITVQGTTDLGEGLTQKTGAIFLTNGPSGDIVIDGAKLHVTSEHDGTPSLIAYAGTGQVTVKGNIVLDGTSSAPAGQVLLVGDEIRSTGATISAKDTLADAAEKPAKVVLATSKLTLAGALTIEANSKAQTSVKVVPKGSITLDPQDNFPGIQVYVDKFPVNVTEDEVLVGGSANLTIKTKSDGAKVEITAKPLKFNNGTSQIFATGQGSQIVVDFPGSPLGTNSLIFNGDGVTFDASNPDGNAGTVNIIADKVRNTASANVSLKANGGGTNGSGGVVALTVDRGNLDLGSGIEAISITANSKGGNKGSILIDNSNNNGKIHLQEQTLAPAIDASALVVDGEGGDITITAGQFINTSTGESAQILANGAETKPGGTITVQADTIHLLDAVIKADGGSSRGNGGDINIVSPNPIQLGRSNTQLAILSAQGFGDGNGGDIKISSGTVNLINAEIKANGGTDGMGGTLEVADAVAFPINIVVDVSLGTSVSNTSTFGGSITLNGIKCQQWLTGFSWPRTYWNCANPEAPNALDLIPAEVARDLPSSTRTDLNGKKLTLYTMTNQQDWFTFFRLQADTALGVTYVEDENTIDSSIFREGALPHGGPSSLSADSVREVAAHELGHVDDFARSYYSTVAPYFGANGLFEHDIAYLVNAGPPCSTNHTAPFDDLIDFQTGQPFCDSNGQLVTSQYANLNNYEIAVTSQQILGPGQLNGHAGYTEPYAQAFGYHLLNIPNAFLFSTADGLLQKGYFACAQQVAAARMGRTYVPSYACN